MQDKQLRYMVEIGRLGSLSAAARHLGISQPALSQFLANEEQRLGTRLFISYGNRLIPTPAGNVYISAASRMLKIRDQTYSRIMRSEQDNIRKIKLGVPNQFFDILAARVVPSIYGRIKNLDIEIRDAISFDLKSKLEVGELDMAIIGSSGSPDSREAGYVFIRCEICILVPRVFDQVFPLMENEKFYEFMPLEELKDHPFILPEGKSILKDVVEDLFSQTGYTPHISYSTDNPFVAMELAAQGFGAAFMTLNAALNADLSRCRIFLLESRPSIYYGIRLREHKEPDEVETMLIRKLIKAALREGNDSIYLNEASRHLLEAEEED